MNSEFFNDHLFLGGEVIKGLLAGSKGTGPFPSFAKTSTKWG